MLLTQSEFHATLFLLLLFRVFFCTRTVSELLFQFNSKRIRVTVLLSLSLSHSLSHHLFFCVSLLSWMRGADWECIQQRRQSTISESTNTSNRISAAISQRWIYRERQCTDRKVCDRQTVCWKFYGCLDLSDNL